MNGLMYFTSVPLPPHYHLVYSIPKEILSFHNKLPRRIPLVLNRGGGGRGIHLRTWDCPLKTQQTRVYTCCCVYLLKLAIIYRVLLNILYCYFFSGEAKWAHYIPCSNFHTRLSFSRLTDSQQWHPTIFVCYKCSVYSFLQQQRGYFSLNLCGVTTEKIRINSFPNTSK